MNGMQSSFSIEHFLLGLAVGLVVALAVYIFQLFAQSTLKKQITALKKHLHLKMDIDAESTQLQRAELLKLQKENENLRVTNQVLAQKPGRKEIIAFQINQKAIRIMSEMLVGFAPAWQKALKEAESEMAEIEAGRVPFLKRFLPDQFFGLNTKNSGSGRDTDPAN